MKKQSISVSQAIQIIIADATRPPQIDYVSPGEKQRVRQAEDFINSLPTAEKVRINDEIIEAIDSYYIPSIIASDNKCYSPAELDAMF